MQSELVWVVVGALLVALLAAFIAGRAPVQALERMRAHAEQIGAGDFAARVEEPRMLELRSLAHALNDMTGKLVDLKEEALARSRLDTFARVASGLAHDLQHPIRHVRSAFGLALARPDDPEARRVMRRAFEVHLGRLDGYLTELRRLAHGDQPRLHLAPIDPMKLARQVVTEVQEIEAYRGVMVDAQGLIELSEDASFVTIGVRDNGPGLDAARLAEVLGGDFHSSKRTSGVGLGLAVVKHVALVHGGDLTGESTPGVGTVFRLRLRRTEAPAQAELGGGVSAKVLPLRNHGGET
jgi:signal transduction histidine kinase